MIRLDAESLRKLQMIELELLLEADRICRKCGIRYNIIAGTMLGAVRHGGFIPWDDDADIALLRPEYERFREACKTELDHSRFYFQDHTVTPGYRWGYGKLRRKDTLFLREHQEHIPYEQGVFIDVFPLDAVPDSRAGRAFVNAECFLIRKLLWSRAGKVSSGNRWIRLLYAALDRVPETAVLKTLESRIRRASQRETEWVRILTFPTPNREYGYRKKWYAGSEEAVFEGHVFPGVKDPDGYLRFKFGDYMTPPPEDQRKTHPVSALRLTEPQMTGTEDQEPGTGT